MSEPSEPDLSLIEADIRNVVTVKELVEELRRINQNIDLIREAIGETIVQLDRIPVIEKWVQEIGLGLGVRV